MKPKEEATVNEFAFKLFQNANFQWRDLPRNSTMTVVDHPKNCLHDTKFQCEKEVDQLSKRKKLKNSLEAINFASSRKNLSREIKKKKKPKESWKLPMIRAKKLTRVRWPQNVGTNRKERRKKTILKNKILNILENEILENKFYVRWSFSVLSLFFLFGKKLSARVQR